MSLQFVNIHGEKLTERRMQETAKAQRKPKPPSEAKSFHKGFRVVGRPAGALEEAREAHERVIAMSERSGGKEIRPWDEAAWLAKFKPKPVRAKPYEIRSAAVQCAELARKAGWLDVVVVELSSEA